MVRCLSVLQLADFYLIVDAAVGSNPNVFYSHSSHCVNGYRKVFLSVQGRVFYSYVLVSVNPSLG